MTELLLNLPNEVIDLIFQSIPNSLLIGLEDIPPIRPYVLNQLYKSVIVGYPLSSTHTVKHNDIVDDLKLSTQDYIPTFINYRELINFINTNLLHPPEEIFFTNPLEILIVDETYPDLLSNSKISTTFKQFTTTHHNHQDEAYLEKLSHISYHKINDANFINTSHFPTIWKINHRSCRYYIQIPDFFTNLPSFHLSKLEIGPLQSLNADLAKCIPDTISSLDCTIDPGSHINGTLVMMRDFILPKRLVSLTMNFEIEMCPKVLDLSLMDRLKYLYLRYDSSCFDVVYPSAVIGVMGDSGIDVCDLFRMCRSPLLVFDHLGPLRMGDGGVRIGERLTEMRVGCVTIYEMIVNQLVRFSGSCLRKLTVRCCKGTMSSQQCFDSDAEVVDFRELSGLQELDVAEIIEDNELPKPHVQSDPPYLPNHHRIKPTIMYQNQS
ncbi:hypothetical protein G210_2692 [Candida maltosa Xu316]|uniref:F-box domain-containing protein n=1 Tax=Candida maltosa (strain Xu316) TaxID=1245528 RepID=M3J4U2_CANMX|nr:hypothetical protein G210_2692 [Candida maltosa Xu316]